MAPTTRDPSRVVALDANGAPWVDPTPNVIALVEANAKSAAMLREADIKFNDSQAAHLKEIGALRAENAQILRTSDLATSEKTRQVDVLAAAASAATLATAVQTLATNTDRNAETIRNQLNADRAALAKLVSDTAVNVSTQNDSLFKVVNSQIAELQKSSYQGVGKSSVADPMISEAILEMKKMASGIYERRGRDEVADPALTATLAQIATAIAAQSTALADLKTSRSEASGATRGGLEQRQLVSWLLAAALALMGIYTFTQRQTTAAPQIIVVPAGAQIPSAVQTGPPTQTPR